MARLSISGGRELERKLRALPPTVRRTASRVVVKHALGVQSQAKRLCPIDTGRLRNSIAVADGEPLLDRLSGAIATIPDPPRGGRITQEAGLGIKPGMILAVIGTVVHYGPNVEFGLLRQRPQPFLFPAAEAARGPFQADLRQAIVAAEREVAR